MEIQWRISQCLFQIARFVSAFCNSTYNSVSFASWLMEKYKGDISSSCSWENAFANRNLGVH